MFRHGLHFITFCCIVGKILCCISLPPAYTYATWNTDLSVSTTQTQTQTKNGYSYYYQVCNIRSTTGIGNILIIDSESNIKWFIEAGGDNFIYNTAAPNYYDVNTNCPTSVDGAITYGWWMELILLSDVYISGMYLETHPYYQYKYPYRLVGSNDGVNYNSISSSSMTAYYDTIHFIKRKYQYWRVIVTGASNKGDSIIIRYFELKIELCSPGQFFDSSCMCQTCSPGSYSNHGSTNACLLCAAGTYSTHLGSSSANNCINCDVMKFSSTAGASTCDTCPIGSFTINAGSSSCDMCAPGSMPNGISGCSACPSGTYGDNGQCSPCIKGTYSTGEEQLYSTTCLACDKGKTFIRLFPMSIMPCMTAPYFVVFYVFFAMFCVAMSYFVVFNAFCHVFWR